MLGVNMNKKILSVNLWYEKYGNKTKTQLKSFRRLSFETYAATISSENGSMSVVIYKITGKNSLEEIVYKEKCSNYKDAFKMMFDYAIDGDFSIVYIRRLMSKLFYASSVIKEASKAIPIVYEIPTYPLDTGNGFLYSLRDKLEMALYSSVSKSIKITLVNNIADKPAPYKWTEFHNALDIDNYELSGIPELSDTIKMVIIANISEYHRYDRVLDAMHNYNGDKKISLTVISPDSPAYSAFKSKVTALSLTDSVSCLSSMSLNEIKNFAKEFHIGVGQLSISEKGSNLVNTLKSKDYCAMGLPFFSTCYDTSFEKDFPYAYVTKDMDSDIDLNDIVSWFLNIYSDSDYRRKMFSYAEANLQYDKYAKMIAEICNY